MRNMTHDSNSVIKNIGSTVKVLLDLLVLTPKN